MGTNFFIIPTEDEIKNRKERLINRIQKMELSPKNIKNDFCYIQNSKNDWDAITPWDEFLNDMKIHLGKRSMGWKFLWNFNKNKYYHDKETLFTFIRSGRVVDEYGYLIDNEEFIKNALEWGEPDGYVFNEEYLRSHPSERTIFSTPENFSKIIDGLVVSAHDEFS